MKVDFYVIASGGEDYGSMKKAFLKNWENDDRKKYFEDSELRFLYNIYSNSKHELPEYDAKWDGDTFFGFEESIIPGITLKTISMLRLDSRRNLGDRWVVRTNLSSFYLWKRLRDFLDELENMGVDASGYSGTEDHFSGCGFVLGPKAVKKVLEAEARGELDYSVEDDVAMSKVIFSDENLSIVWAQRVDIINGNIEFRRCCDDRTKVFHIRVKSFGNRKRDAEILNLFANDPSKVLKTINSSRLVQ